MGLFTEKPKPISVSTILDILEVNDMQDMGCCGIQVIHGFESFDLSEIKNSARNFKLALSRCTNDQVEAISVVNVNSIQVSTLNPILVKAGYRMVTKGLNKKTGNSIYMYTKVLNKTRKGVK